MEQQEDREYLEIELKVINALSDNYDLIEKIELNGDQKIFLGYPSRKECRFCGNRYPEVKFSTEAHAIPEFFGNKTLISLYECDVCNERFSRTVEDHFAKYLGLARTINMLKGKKKIASYKNKNSRIDVKGGKLVVQHSFDDEELYSDNPQLKEITFKGIRQPYIPAAVFKCLVKMALSIMPENEIANFREAIEWIYPETHDIIKVPNLKVIVTFVPGPKPFPYITNYLYRRKRTTTKDNLFYMLYVVTFGNWVYQIHLPLALPDQSLLGMNIDVPRHLARFPAYYQKEFGKPQVSLLDWSSIEEVRGGAFEIKMSYDEKIEGEEVTNEAKRIIEQD